MILGIDLDGVLTETLQGNRFNNLYNKTRIEKNNNIKYKIANKVMKTYFNIKWRNWEKIKIKESEIPEILDQIINKYSIKINIITSSFGKEEYIRSWLKENKINYNELVFSNPTDKYKYCDILIDDRIENIIPAVKNNKFGILYSNDEIEKRIELSKDEEKRMFVIRSFKYLEDVLRNINMIIYK